jgi:TetR/AcrR family transcriptional regulator, transcriptional repressor for nem operon
VSWPKPNCMSPASQDWFWNATSPHPRTSPVKVPTRAPGDHAAGENSLAQAFTQRPHPCPRGRLPHGRAQCLVDRRGDLACPGSQRSLRPRRCQGADRLSVTGWLRGCSARAGGILVYRDLFHRAPSGLWGPLSYCDIARLGMLAQLFIYLYGGLVGRPRIFDEEQVVDRAMELFWTKGYEATSVSDLAAEFGVHPGSLYRTFGDKHVLFLRALARYRDSQARALAPSLLAGGPVLPRIRAVLVDFIELTAEQDKPRGWLAANTVGELLPGDKDAACGMADVLSDVEDGFLQGLRAAARQGEIAGTLDLPGWAATLTMLVQGLQVVAKADPDPRRLVRGVGAARSRLCRGADERHTRIWIAQACSVPGGGHERCRS